MKDTPSQSWADYRARRESLAHGCSSLDDVNMALAEQARRDRPMSDDELEQLRDIQRAQLKRFRINGSGELPGDHGDAPWSGLEVVKNVVLAGLIGLGLAWLIVGWAVS